MQSEQVRYELLYDEAVNGYKRACKSLATVQTRTMKGIVRREIALWENRMKWLDENLAELGEK